MLTSPRCFALGVQDHQRAGVVGAEQIAASLCVGGADGQAGDAGNGGAVRPEAIPVERHRLHADHAPIADVHLQLSVAVEVAEPHVGDAAVGMFQGVFGKVGDEIPVLVEDVAALLRDQEGDEVAMAVGADGGAKAADGLLFREFELVQGDQLAVQADLGHRRAVLDHQQPLGPALDRRGRGYCPAFSDRRISTAGASFSVRGSLRGAISALGSGSSFTTTASPGLRLGPLGLRRFGELPQFLDLLEILFHRLLKDLFAGQHLVEFRLQRFGILGVQSAFAVLHDPLVVDDERGGRLSQVEGGARRDRSREGSARGRSSRRWPSPCSALLNCDGSRQTA